MWKSLNWVVISSEKNWRLQLDVSISMLWSKPPVLFRMNYYSMRDFHMVSPQVAFPYLSTSPPKATSFTSVCFLNVFMFYKKLSDRRQLLVNATKIIWKLFRRNTFIRMIRVPIVLARGVSGCLLDTLFHLSFTCKYIVSEQFGDPVLKFPANLDTELSNFRS